MKGIYSFSFSARKDANVDTIALSISVKKNGENQFRISENDFNTDDDNYANIGYSWTMCPSSKMIEFS